MSSINSNGTNGATDKPSPIPANLSADIALLRSLLKEDANQDGADEPDVDIDELLRRLETADGIAQGVESRLDDIIDNLDGLLESLEAQTQTREGRGTGTADERAGGGETDVVTQQTAVKVTNSGSE